MTPTSSINRFGKVVILSSIFSLFTLFAIGQEVVTPSGSIAGHSSGSKISADAFKAQAGLGVFLKDSPLKMKFEVVSYKLTMDAANGDIIELQNSGAAFNENTRKNINTLKKGNMVTIESILVKDENGKVVKLPSLVYFIQ